MKTDIQHNNSRPIRQKYFLMALAFSLCVTTGGCGEPFHRNTSDSVSTSVLGPNDQCNTTQDCKNIYGPDAIDCENSKSDQSWCECTGGVQCDSDQDPDGDQCDSTQDCKNIYGPNAIDCVNSQSDQSWCKCVGGARCDFEPDTTTCSATDFLGECTTTSGCKSMYAKATDCKNSSGGVCYCSTEVCGCLDDCIPNCNNKECGDDGCEGSCGTCAQNETCENSLCVGCIPNCNNKECGDDGCEGSCGTCAQNETCENSLCVGCIPNCNNKECGDDGCEGSCGTCAQNETCENSLCVGCTPNCNGKECGDDGCEGSCGTCDQDHFCDSSQQCIPQPETGTKHTYTPDYASIFPNPERGWHNRRDLDGRGGDDDRNFSNIKKAGHTLVHSYLRLDDFANKGEISVSYLNHLQEALDAIRTYGLKVVFRPSYVWNTSPSVPEARILKHIEQINEVFSANADVVMHLEAGYLGKWGEWHSGLHTSLSDKSKAATRYRIVKKILDTTPNTIPIAIRYPMSLKEILDYESLVGGPPSGSQSLTQIERDRLGQHNDCFLYNENDRGTYARGGLWFGSYSLQEQKQYAFGLITSYGGNKVMGGETCDGMGRFADTQNDMAAANWTEINVDFWRNFIQAWKNQNLPAQGNDPAETTYARLSRKMGYRLRLEDATFKTMASAGGIYSFSANLNNDGYASVIKKRPVFLVFINAANRYNIQLNQIDVRTWVSGHISIGQQTISLPAEMQSGTYTLAMWLPDASSNLRHRPEYSIRFANIGTWKAQQGYNVLSDSILIQ